MIPQTSDSKNPKSAARDILKFLRKTYPEAFASSHARPLVIGTHIELRTRHPELEHGPLALALRWHCKNRRYMSALARKGSHRYDLEGNPVVRVSEDERKIAVDWLEKHKRPIEEPPATPPPPIEEPPATPASIARPILRLKKPASAIVAVAIARREVVS